MEQPEFKEVSRTLQILLGTPFLGGLTRLVLSACGLSSRELAPLVESSILGRLRELDLSGNEIGPKGAQVLAEAPFGPLRILPLAGNSIGDAGVKALAASGGLTGLIRLDLRGIPLSEAARAALRERFEARVLLD